MWCNVYFQKLSTMSQNPCQEEDQLIHRRYISNRVHNSQASHLVSVPEKIGEGKAEEWSGTNFPWSCLLSMVCTDTIYSILETVLFSHKTKQSKTKHPVFLLESKNRTYTYILTQNELLMYWHIEETIESSYCCKWMEADDTIPWNKIFANNNCSNERLSLFHAGHAENRKSISEVHCV